MIKPQNIEVLQKQQKENHLVMYLMLEKILEQLELEKKLDLEMKQQHLLEEKLDLPLARKLHLHEMYDLILVPFLTFLVQQDTQRKEKRRCCSSSSSYYTR